MKNAFIRISKGKVFVAEYIVCSQQLSFSLLYSEAAICLFLAASFWAKSHNTGTVWKWKFACLIKSAVLQSYLTSYFSYKTKFRFLKI